MSARTRYNMSLAVCTSLDWTGKVTSHGGKVTCWSPTMVVYSGVTKRHQPPNLYNRRSPEGICIFNAP